MLPRHEPLCYDADYFAMLITMRAYLLTPRHVFFRRRQPLLRSRETRACRH